MVMLCEPTTFNLANPFLYKSTYLLVIAHLPWSQEKLYDYLLGALFPKAPILLLCKNMQQKKTIKLYSTQHQKKVAIYDTKVKMYAKAPTSFLLAQKLVQVK